MRWWRWSRHQRRDSPVACGENHGETGCPPAAHRGPWWSKYSLTSCEGLRTGAGGWALDEDAAHGKSMLEQDSQKHSASWREATEEKVF